MSGPFLTDIDSRAAIKGSRDPLGVQPIWTRMGRHVVGNLTTVSTSVRDFTVLLLGYWFAERVAESGGGDGDLAVFLKWEQLAAYSRWLINGDHSFRGTERTGRNLEEGRKVRLGADPASQILSNQKTYGLWGHIPLSHAAAIKLVQLEEALRGVDGGVAMYYDQNGLVPEAGPAKLDVQRIAVRHRTGVFHPKSVFLLVEDAEPGEDGEKHRALLVACLSANLTQAGWWENVEVCHVEEIHEGDTTRLKDGLLGFLASLERRVGDRAAGRHGVLRAIRDFLKGTGQRQQRSTGGFLLPHFFDGTGAVVDFLRDTCGASLDGTNLEIISPYFDGEPASQPLLDLIERFRPREVRVFLPRKDSGEALCSPGFYGWVRSLEPRGVRWGRLPGDLLRRGKGEDVKRRFVHAKVYRFFSTHPRREVLFVGSPNLTRAAHQAGGNVETGFLVEVDTPRRPDWWMEVEGARPKAFEARTENEGTASAGGTRLAIRYSWNTGDAEVFWDDGKPSPALAVEDRGVRLFEVGPLAPRAWTALDEPARAQLQRVLKSTSLLTVLGDGPEPALVLVQEEGMSHKPSLLLDLSPAEILRYWSLLTVEQRAAAIEAHASVPADDKGAALVIPYRLPDTGDTLFDRFAGIFHAFGCLERTVRASLREGKERDAVYRLFGRKYDSLHSLIARVLKEDAEGRGTPVDHYVILLCARQAVAELERDHPEFWQAHGHDARALRDQLASIGDVRRKIEQRDPGEMPAFLDWFERWFLKRAAPRDGEEP